eukprot:m.182831 g.182831  ORF g.182831 m.182831 type:complete len:579 (+) comp15635_c0_seq1:305-2041(+)
MGVSQSTHQRVVDEARAREARTLTLQRSLKEAQRRLEQSIEAEDATQSMLEAEREASAAAMSNTQEDLARLRATLAAERRNHADVMEKQKDDYTREMRQMEQQFNAVKRAHLAQIEDLSRHLAETVAEREDDRQETEGEMARWETEVSHLRHQLAVSDMNMANLEETVSLLEQENNDLQALIDALSEKLRRTTTMHNNNAINNRKSFDFSDTESNFGWGETDERFLDEADEMATSPDTASPSPTAPVPPPRTRTPGTPRPLSTASDLSSHHHDDDDHTAVPAPAVVHDDATGVDLQRARNESWIPPKTGTSTVVHEPVQPSGQSTYATDVSDGAGSDAGSADSAETADSPPAPQLTPPVAVTTRPLLRLPPSPPPPPPRLPPPTPPPSSQQRKTVDLHTETTHAHDDDDAAAGLQPSSTVPPSSIPDWPLDSIGTRVVVSRYGEGVLRWVGRHAVHGEPRCGVELDRMSGKNNGMVGGFQYFVCKAGHGVLAKPTRVNAVQSRRSATARALPKLPTSAPMPLRQPTPPLRRRRHDNDIIMAPQRPGTWLEEDDASSQATDATHARTLPQFELSDALAL